jgi:hypothetical protein
MPAYEFAAWNRFAQFLTSRLCSLTGQDEMVD